MVECDLTFAEIAVFVFNVVFVIGGLGLITIGALAFVQLDKFHEFIGEIATPFPIVLIVVGVIIFVIAFLGCCGVLRKSTCMLYTFSIIMILIVIFQIGIIVAAFTLQNEVSTIVVDKLNVTLRESKENKAYYRAWHVLQTELNCCGIYKPDDWKLANSTLPPSCCLLSIDRSDCTEEKASKIGCKYAFVDFINKELYLFMGIPIVVGFVQLLSIIFSCCLYSVYRRN